MIRWMLIFTVGLVVAFAQKQSSEKKGRDNPAAAKAVTGRPATGKPAAVSIPAGSIEVSPGVYKHTDSAGKESIYRKTPFGVVKQNEPAEGNAISTNTGNPFSNAQNAPSKPTAPLVTVTEEGDTIRFERSTPFGPSRWTRKKSELSAEEQEMLERSRAAKSGNPGPKE